jgi:hypothetical protein
MMGVGVDSMNGVSEKQHAHELIERLPEAQIPTAVRFLEFMLLDG